MTARTHRRTLLIAGLLIGLGAVALPTAPPAEAAAGFPIPLPGGDIFGDVRQRSTGLPLGKGVHVTLSVKGVEIATSTTNDSGQFAFEGLRPGRYTLSTPGGRRTVSIGSFSAFVTLFVK